MLLTFALSFSRLSIAFIFGQAATTFIWALEGSFLLAYGVIYERKTRGPSFAVLSLGLEAAAFLIYFFGPYLHLPGGWTLTQSAGLLKYSAQVSPLALTGFIFALSAFISVWFFNVLEREGLVTNIKIVAMEATYAPTKDCWPLALPFMGPYGGYFQVSRLGFRP
ncbi:MAG: hypothetical protein LBE31_00490 [Deltaproteobacteria bacterium]|nr:hypothetical protein [Deltaproteobacteria bacterium]